MTAITDTRPAESELFGVRCWGDIAPFLPQKKRLLRSQNNGIILLVEISL